MRAARSTRAWRRGSARSATGSATPATARVILGGALDYYRAVGERVPGDREANLWLGRIFFELGQPEDALPYWQKLVEASSDDAGARYYLERTQQQLAFGVAASNAFQQGITFYESGRLEEALTEFRAAYGANSAFTEALVWTGRTALELGRSDEAKRAWEGVLASNPDDARARYFLSVAEDQLTWGAEAVQAFEAGLARYNAGEFGAAADSFAEALEANPDYKDAAVWAARSFQESEQAQRAVAYWQRAQALDPDDTRIPYFLGLARDQARFGASGREQLFPGLCRATNSPTTPTPKPLFKRPPRPTRTTPTPGAGWAASTLKEPSTARRPTLTAARWRSSPTTTPTPFSPMRPRAWLPRREAAARERRKAKQ